MYQYQAIWCLVVNLEPIRFANAQSLVSLTLDMGGELTLGPAILHPETEDLILWHAAHLYRDV